MYSSYVIYYAAVYKVKMPDRSVMHRV